jgi:hypothetical protein
MFVEQLGACSAISPIKNVSAITYGRYFHLAAFSKRPATGIAFMGFAVGNYFCANNIHCTLIIY